VRLPGVNPLGDLRAILDAMGDIRDSLALLPEVAGTLAEIREGVRYMSDEVHTMRTGVDDLSVEVKGMRAAVDPLVAHLDLVAKRVEELEPRLEDLSLAIHPLRRATGKLGRRRAANGEPGITDEEAQASAGEDLSQDAGSPDE
jgi:hypothetical protein